jgi:spore maturation protein CgeB
MNAAMAELPAPHRPVPRPRVLVIGSHCFHDSMEWHVVEGLRELGCPVEFFEARSFGGIQSNLQKALQKGANLLLREPERMIERRLLAAIERCAPQLILVVLGHQLSPKTVQLMRARTTAPFVAWCQDQMTTLGRQYLLGAGYDAVFVKDRYMQDLFSRMLRSTTFHYLAEACNPAVHRTIELTARDRELYGCDVMIAGSLYYFRQEVLRSLSGMDLKIYGYQPEWLVERLSGTHTRRNVFGDDKARASRAARIALNTLHYAEVNGLNCRAFELAGCGAFQLITAKPVLAEHFRPGDEVETFDNVDELVEKARFYLRNPERARQIADAGQRRAHRDHTYARRLEELLGVTFAGASRSADEK